MSHQKPTLWQRLTAGPTASPPNRASGAAPQIVATLANPILPADTERETRIVVEFSLLPPDRSALQRLPVHCGLTLDKSSSMAGAKMAQAIAAACALLPAMQASDLLTVVDFNAQANTIVGPAAPGRQAEQAIRSIRASGGTNIGAALDLGYSRLQGGPHQQRLLLVSDGEPSVGDCDEESLARRAAQARERGIVTSTLGIGNGYNARLMARIAEAGGGAHRFVDNPQALPALFQAELASAAFTAAVDAVLTLLPSQGVRVTHACPFPLQPQPDSTVCIPVGNLDAAQPVDALVDLLAPPRSAGPVRLARAWLTYCDPGAGKSLRTEAVDLVAQYSADPVEAARAANPEVMRRRQVCRAAGQVKTVLDASLTVQERTQQLAEVQRTLAETGMGGSALSRTLTETIAEMGRGVQGGAGEKTLVETAHVVTRGERLPG
jgi:hypothetical protein